MSRRRWPRASVALLACALAGPTGADDDDTAATPGAPAEYAGGVPVVTLMPAQVAGAAIEAASFAREQVVLEARALARVLDLQPLIDLRARYRAAQAEQALVEAGRAATRDARERLRVLNADGGNVSTGRLREAEAAARADDARALAVARRVEDLRTQAVHRYGPALAGWALDGDPLFERLLRREDVLLLLTLAPNDRLDESTSVVYVDRDGDRAQARKAYLVGAAPEVDTRTRGETWLFRTDAARLRTGTRLDAWVPDRRALVDGVPLPESAVVWHAGRRWAYVEIGAGRYARRELADVTVVGDRVFVRAGVDAQDRVVVRGALVLLSEESRWNIPSEDEVD